MTTITTRSGKGSPLTNSEVDANFTNLNNDKLELSGGTITSGTSTGLTINHDTFGEGLVIHRNDTTTSAAIQFKNNSGKAGVLWANESGGQLYWRERTSTTNQRVFHDNYHPNADKWTTSRTLSLTGDVTGSVSWDGSGNASLAATVANDSHNHDGRYYTESEADSRFVNATGDTMTGDLLLDASNAEINIKSGITGTSGAVNWTFNTTGTNYASIKLPYDTRATTGLHIDSGYPITIDATTRIDFDISGTTYATLDTSGLSIGSNDVFHDGYHPNADKWTTARTINLGGDLTGSVSIDGSANVTLTASVTDDSHTHNRIVEKSAIDYGAAYLQWTDISGTGGSNGNGNAPSNPTTDWYHHIIANHGNSGGYYVDIAQSFHSDAVYHRRLTNGSLTSWQRFFTDAYHPNADKWTTARTLSLSGDASGSVSWDGSANATLSVTVADDSHNHDGRYYTESEVNTFINRSYVSSHQAGNLAVGWYTIAQNTGNRAVARFALWDTNSSDHQSVIFYASHHYGQDASNTLTVLDNSYFSGNPFRYLRIKDAGTYDGAALQVYIDDATNNVNIAIVGDDVQSSGWDIVDFLADATAPSQVSNWANFGERSRIDLNQIAQGGLATTGPIYADGDTTQYRVFNDNYHPNADTLTTARTINGVSFNGSANITIADSTKLPLSGGTMTGDLTINEDGDSINLRSTTNAASIGISFSDQVTTGTQQIGHIRFNHADGVSYGSNALLKLGSTEPTTTILADGKLMYDEGIYSKPASGTGAGTRKDANWDTAYTTANAALPKAGGTMTGTLTGRDIQPAAGYHLRRSNHHSGHLEGSYNNVGTNSAKTNPIYSIGSSYNPNEDTLNNFYGIGFSKNTASFMTGALDAGNNNGWGLYVAADGDARIFLNGTHGIINSIGEHYVNSQRVFHDGYHPNADTLTTARTINGVSFNGSANITVADSTKLPLTGGTMTGALSISQGTAGTASLSVTNSGGSGNNALIASFIGDSDALQIRNDSNGDYKILNNQQNNGISIYDGTGGVKLRYNGTDVAGCDASGGFEVTSGNLSVTNNITVSGTVDGRDVATDGTKLDTIATNANSYVHPTGNGNNHIPSDGSSQQFLKYSSAGTAVWSTPYIRFKDGDGDQIYVYHNHSLKFKDSDTILTNWQSTSPSNTDWELNIYVNNYSIGHTKIKLGNSNSADDVTGAFLVNDGADGFNWSASPSVTDINVDDQIISTGDTNTYMQFHAADQWRVVTGGTERLEVNNTNTTVANNLIVSGNTTFNGTVTGISAGAEDDIFWENNQAVTSNYTITNNKNAMSAGPITINSGVTVTVGDGEAWTVV